MVGSSVDLASISYLYSDLGSRHARHVGFSKGFLHSLTVCEALRSGSPLRSVPLDVLCIGEEWSRATFAFVYLETIVSQTPAIYLAKAYSCKLWVDISV